MQRPGAGQDSDWTPSGLRVHRLRTKRVRSPAHQDRRAAAAPRGSGCGRIALVPCPARWEDQNAMSTDLTVILEHRPGELARLGEVTGEAGVSVRCLAAFTGDGRWRSASCPGCSPTLMSMSILPTPRSAA